MKKKKMENKISMKVEKVRAEVSASEMTVIFSLSIVRCISYAKIKIISLLNKLFHFYYLTLYSDTSVCDLKF